MQLTPRPAARGDAAAMAGEPPTPPVPSEGEFASARDSAGLRRRHSGVGAQLRAAGGFAFRLYCRVSTATFGRF